MSAAALRERRLGPCQVYRSQTYETVVFTRRIRERNAGCAFRRPGRRTARAHLDLRPRLVVQGELTDVRVELPQLRPGAPPSELEVEGDGIEVRSSELEGTLGSETFWTVRLRADGEPGIVPLALRAVYDDGRSVEVDQQLTVVPAPEGSSFPWPAVAVGAAAGVTFANGYRYRRRGAAGGRPAGRRGCGDGRGRRPPGQGERRLAARRRERRPPRERGRLRSPLRASRTAPSSTTRSSAWTPPRASRRLGPPAELAARARPWS